MNEHLTHFIAWIHQTPGVETSPVLHKVIWKADSADLPKQQDLFADKARKLTGDSGFFFRLVTADEAQKTKTF